MTGIWAVAESWTGATAQILAVYEHTVKYLDVYPTGMVKILSSRIQWEFDVERGELILTTQPDWKGALG